MQAADKSVVLFHYVLKGDDGVQIESSRDGDALAVLLGAGNVIPGMERALLGRGVGERFDVTIPPEDAYGPRREDYVQRIPKKYFRDAQRLRPGDTTVLDTREGPRMVMVSKVGESVVDVDLNHPMAGQTLHFDLEIVEVREASEEELAHGHVHGPGGHHH
jgi:FKBP-type peptidyl-prolyl cis-trans isomerase SlyD